MTVRRLRVVLLALAGGGCHPASPVPVPVPPPDDQEETAPTVSRTDGKVELRVVREGEPLTVGALATGLGLPDGGRSLIEGCATSWRTTTAIAWVDVHGDRLEASVDASDPAVRTCLARAFARLPVAPGLDGATAAFVLRLGEWTDYRPFPRPGPYTRARLDVGIVGGTLGGEREGTVLPDVDARLAVLSEDLARCTDGAGEAVVRVKVAAGAMSAPRAEGSTAALAACARDVFARSQPLPSVGDADFVVSVVWSEAEIAPL